MVLCWVESGLEYIVFDVFIYNLYIPRCKKLGNFVQTGFSVVKWPLAFKNECWVTRYILNCARLKTSYLLSLQ